MKYLVAVSGGIDSVVLLDMLVKEAAHELIVAHFDHGIRGDSAADARFVEALAEQYGLLFVGAREELGKDASEELARTQRYRFLGEEALLYKAKIVTAHHQNDILETIAINLMRGTGWRGLAVFDGRHVIRPLLNFTKEEIREYALRHKLEWVEDSTNDSDAYLRNRLRRKLYEKLSPESFQKIIGLWNDQLELRAEIESEAPALLAVGPQSRYFFTQIDEKSAEELLRAYSDICLSWSPTRPQLKRSLLAIKAARAGASFPFGRARLVINKTDFCLSVKTP